MSLAKIKKSTIILLPNSLFFTCNNRFLIKDHTLVCELWLVGFQQALNQSSFSSCIVIVCSNILVQLLNIYCIFSNFTSNIRDFLPFTSMYNQPNAFKENGGCLPFIRSVAVEPALKISGNGRFSTGELPIQPTNQSFENE